MNQDRLKFEIAHRIQLELRTFKQAKQGNEYAKQHVNWVMNKRIGKIPIKCTHTIETKQGKIATILPILPQIEDEWAIQELVCTQCEKVVYTAIRKLKKPKRRF